MSNRATKKSPAPAGSPLPSGFSHLGLGLPSLQFEGDPALELSLDRWRIAEAFRRGGSAIEILFLVTRSRAAMSALAPPPDRPRASLLGGSGPLLGDPEWGNQRLLASMIAEAEMNYRDRMRQEFQALPKEVQQAFAFAKASPFDHYLRIRPAYYNAGFDDPAEAIFSKMVPATLVTRRVVPPGVHQALAERLPEVDKLLNQWRLGLAGEMGKQIHSVGGFVPRYIAHREGQKHPPVLSNHALGLAIDIDPSSNPHIKDPAVIAILNEIAKPSGIDYGKAIAERGSLSAEDWAAQTHTRAQQASNLIKGWLAKYLPVYETLEERLKLEQKIAQAKKPEEKEQLLEKLSGLSGQASGGAPAKAVTPALKADEAAAVEQIRTLRKFHPLSEIKIWAMHGIQTIPLMLAVALVKAGMRWGQAYKSTKDAMHFELVDGQGRSVVRPDSPPRSLEDLFPVAGSPAPPKPVAKRSNANQRK